MRELSESRKMMELEVLHHRSQLRLEFLTLEAFVSEMDWAIADLVETARCRVDDEGSEGADGCQDRPHPRFEVRRSPRLRGDRGHLRYSRAQPGHAMRSGAASDAPKVLCSRSSRLRPAAVLHGTLDLLPTQNASWKGVERLQLVRHCIAHVGGHVPSVRNRPTLEPALRELEIQVGADGYLTVPRAVVEGVVEDAKKWVFEVVDGVQHALPSATRDRRRSTHEG